MCACVPFMRPVFDRWIGGAYLKMGQGANATSRGQFETMRLAKPSVDWRRHNGSASTSVESGGRVHSDLTGAVPNQWHDIESDAIKDIGPRE